MVKLLHQVNEPCLGQLSMCPRSDMLVYKTATSRGGKASERITLYLAFPLSLIW